MAAVALDRRTAVPVCRKTPLISGSNQDTISIKSQLWIESQLPISRFQCGFNLGFQLGLLLGTILEVLEAQEPAVFRQGSF